VKGAAEAIQFYKQAFGARESQRFTAKDESGQAKVLYAEMTLGDSRFCLSDECVETGALGPQGSSSSVFLNLNVTDAQAAFKQAVAAGANTKMPLTDMYWGDRYGQITDPYGQCWAIIQHIEDVPAAEIQRRMDNQQSAK